MEGENLFSWYCRQCQVKQETADNRALIDYLSNSVQQELLARSMDWSIAFTSAGTGALPWRNISPFLEFPVTLAR